MSARAKKIVEDEENVTDEHVTDEAEKDETVAPETYNITSFGADYDVEGLVKRLDRKDLLIPEFQRAFIWTQKEGSRFIESLLLGLPVPGIFLAREAGTNRLLVIDGQQRLKTLQFFYSGVFNPRAHEKRQQVFKLTQVQKQFEGCTYKSLRQEDRVKLNDSIIHATIVKQESPADGDTSIYHIFERLNYAGRKLTPQEIRAAIFHGPLVDTVKNLNEYSAWRSIYGERSTRLKDQELILRFLAFFAESEKYSRPMAEFINNFAAGHRNATDGELELWGEVFRSAIGTVYENVGKSAFRLGGTINAAVFDSVMTGVAARLTKGPILDGRAFLTAYEDLLAVKDYEAAVSRATADEAAVASRFRLAADAFANIK